MYIKKTEKEGFILVETMIIVAVCILILIMYNEIGIITTEV